MGLDLQARTAKFVVSKGLVVYGDRILVAVSGGPDSVALLHVLRELRDELGLELEVAHLQHGMRGEEARSDARFLAELAEKLQLPFHLKEVQLLEMKSATGKGNLEALGRAERHRFFSEVAQERKINKVATAHTLNDQAETVAMWFFRGAGLKGLGGMAPLHSMNVDGRPLTVIRPLIEISKAEVLDYLQERGFDYRVDKSNQDLALLRNWLRLDLLPRIERRLDSGVLARLAQQAEIFRDDNALLDAMAQSCYESMTNAGSLSRPALLSAPKALQRRVLRLWIERSRGHLRGLEFVHIDDMLRLIEQGPAQGRVSIAGGWELVRQYETLTLAKRARGQRPVCYSYPYKFESMLRIAEAEIELQSERRPAPQAHPEDLMSAVFDLKSLPASLSVRNFRRGDRFRPLGMAGHKKIKDLFIEKRAPLSVRACWPLLVSNEEVLWIPGFARSAVACVSTNTTAVLQLKAQPISGQRNTQDY